VAFKALCLSHAPDADYTKHRSIIDTGKYKLWAVVVKTQEEAVNVARDLYEREKIEAILLCPGFTHTDVAELFQALEGKVSINVARGDGPSGQIAFEAMQRADFLRK
jgi:hypothetical protein